MNNKTFSLNRRKFLHGAGVALALPWMETFASEKGNNTPKRFFSLKRAHRLGSENTRTT